MKILSLVVLLGLPAAASASETAAFLKIGVGARALAMGGACTAIADDANTIAWNPAGLAGLTKRELSATHEDLTTDTRFDFATYAHPLKFGVLAAAGTYLSQGRISGRDQNGAPTGGYNAADEAAAVAYAARLGGDVDLGAAVKYIHSAIADASAQDAALDLGARYVFPEALGPGTPSVGVAVQNFGPTMKYLDEAARLPLTFSAGLGYRLPAGFTASLDYRERPYSHGSEASFGAEYLLLKRFAVRAGYNTARAYTGDGGAAATFNGFSTGFGVKLSAYSLDYSFAPMGELGSVQTLTLGARF